MVISVAGELKINRFEVIAVSHEFLEIIQELPELSTASEIQIGEKKIKGPEIILVASSMEEIYKKLPDIVNDIATIKNHHLRVIHRQGTCHRCKPKQNGKSVTECPHLKEIATINRSFGLDVQKYFKLKTN